MQAQVVPAASTPRRAKLAERRRLPVIARQALRRAGQAGLAGSLALLPGRARACQLTDPGCYIDDFAHQQIQELAMSIWQINRAGLVLARWVEDLRAWLAETVLVNAFTTLTQPVRLMFALALIIAWMLFVISFMVQALVELRWVDLRRAARPTLLALLVFSGGGSLLRESEQIRLIGSALLQQSAQAAVQQSAAPTIPMVRSGDFASAATGIYEQTSVCGTPARSVRALALNDYDARYLLADANDIHCGEPLQLATEFRATFFPTASIADLASWERRSALSLAAQGGLRQITGLFMTAGALIEQLMHLLFALALALVWFGLLLSLVFAIFLPTEALFTQQLRALLAVIRASWLASFLLGLGLAVLSLVAESGNGFLLLLCGLVLIAVCLWQCRQALAVLQTAASSANAAMAGAPLAVGGMLRGWATTGALVAGVAATGGGMGVALSQVGATMARRMGRQTGGNPLMRAAGRVLSQRVADRLDALTADQRIAQAADLSQAEAAWYERLPANSAPADAPARAGAARRDARTQQARLLERRAARARQVRNFGLADQLWRAAAGLRPTSQAEQAERAESQAQHVPAERLRQAQRASVRAAAARSRSALPIAVPIPPERIRRLRVMQRAVRSGESESQEFLTVLGGRIVAPPSLLGPAEPAQVAAAADAQPLPVQAPGLPVRAEPGLSEAAGARQPDRAHVSSAERLAVLSAAASKPFAASVASETAGAHQPGHTHVSSAERLPVLSAGANEPVAASDADAGAPMRAASDLALPVRLPVAADSPRPATRAPALDQPLAPIDSPVRPDKAPAASAAPVLAAALPPARAGAPAQASATAAPTASALAMASAALAAAESARPARPADGPAKRAPADRERPPEPRQAPQQPSQRANRQTGPAEPRTPPQRPPQRVSADGELPAVPELPIERAASSAQGAPQPWKRGKRGNP